MENENVKHRSLYNIGSADVSDSTYIEFVLEVEQTSLARLSFSGYIHGGGRTELHVALLETPDKTIYVGFDGSVIWTCPQLIEGKQRFRLRWYNRSGAGSAMYGTIFIDRFDNE